MQYLTLPDLLLILEDLFRPTPDAEGNPPRRASAELSDAGKLYLLLLRSKLDILRILPEAQSGKPLASDLGGTDLLHDGLGAAIYYFIEAILRQPLLTANQKEAARRIRGAFIPALADLRKSYADEAAQAKKRQASLEPLANDLRLFTVPGPEGDQTLFDWVRDFLAQGERLDQLLSQRATLSMIDPNAGQGSVLRGEIISMVGTFRTVLAQEIKQRAELPRNLEGLVFGYLDDLCRSREAAAAARAKEPVKEPDPAEEPAVEEA